MIRRFRWNGKRLAIGLAAAAGLAFSVGDLMAQHPVTQNFRRTMPRSPTVPASVSNPLGAGAAPPAFNPNNVFSRYPTNAVATGGTDAGTGGGTGTGTGAGAGTGAGNSGAVNNSFSSRGVNFQSFGNRSSFGNVNNRRFIQNNFNRNAVRSNLVAPVRR